MAAFSTRGTCTRHQPQRGTPVRLETDIRSVDAIGILAASEKARFRVVWVRYDDAGDKMLVAVQRLAADECPWPELLKRSFRRCIDAHGHTHKLI